MQLIFSVILIFLLFDENLSQQIPQKFGLLTVTKSRGNDMSQFMRFLYRYAKMECPIISQINVIWNNQESPQSKGVLVDQELWVRPVHYYITPNNSMNWRYKLHNQSKAQVYFSIDDNILIDCSELQKSFQVWKSKAIGSLGPIVSYVSQFFQYSNKRGFQFGMQKNQNIFNMGLIGKSFISRHFLELYYSDQSQLNSMRQIVIERNNCQDIAMNWISQYYYPELPLISVQGKISSEPTPISRSSSPQFFKVRSQCLKLFTQIFSINPLRYISTHNGKINYPFLKETVLAKKLFFEKQFIKSYSQISQKLQKQLNVFSKQQNQEIKQLKKQLQSYQQINTYLYDQSYKLSADKHYFQQKLNGQTQSLKEEKQKILKDTALLLEQQNQKYENTIHIHLYVQLSMILVICILAYKICVSNKKTSQKSFQRLQNHFDS